MPNRILKDSICTSDNLDNLSWFEEVFFYRLIVNCDDYGRMDARPAILRARLFPLKSITDNQIERALQSLRSAAMIDLYSVDGRSFLQMRTWERHQSTRAKRSKYPAPENKGEAHEITCEQMFSNASECPRNPIRFESDPNPETNPNPNRGGGDPVGVVMSAYMDKINPMPSQTSLDELKHYAERMGAECCLRAFDIALDAKQANWPYIKGILKNKLQQGVSCLADWDRVEKEREERNGTGNNRSSGEHAAGHCGNPDEKWGIKSAII